MLDSTTKRRIDTCRDILVGKVPDPKSQVEQITVALIYKFMDDMDLEAEELGGERKFFTAEYERYRWANLVAPGVSGQDMLNTYSEALTKMVENERLPALFRSIFRNAYLPYRDPETLRSFLREIDNFTYDHSEKLGDAFEYLLSVLGSQGDAGQFRTPRHIIDFMVEIINPKKNETILDPACGTAGFLISAYKHILKANSTHVETANENGGETDATELALESPMRFPGDLLTPEDRERLARNIGGYDISPDMVRLSLVNLYLHGFADPKVEEYDTLTSEEKWTETADVILANPPFMSPKGGIKPHTRFQVQSKRSEVLFVDYMAEHLTPKGRAAIVVPEGIIFQNQSAYVALRKMLVENFLAAVISLPAGVFNPYSGVKTSILILDRAVAKASDHVAFFKIENDGFSLGAQRKAVKGSQLSQVKAELQAWLEAARAGSRAILESSLGNAVERVKLAESAGYNFSGERYKVAAVRTSHWPLVPIGELCELINGRAFKPDDWETKDGGGLPIVRIQNLNNRGATLNYYSGEVRERFIIENGDLLFSWSGSRGTSFGAHLWEGPRAILNQHIFNVKFDETRADKMYLLHILNAVVDQVEDNLHGGVGLVHITKGNLEKIEIPLPPLEVQREIVTEIEGYQKVVDGARAVIDDYRPHIHVDPDWPMIELGDIIDDLETGVSVNSENRTARDGEAGVLKTSAVTSGAFDPSQHKAILPDELSRARCNPRKNSVIISRMNTEALVGASAFVDRNYNKLYLPDRLWQTRITRTDVVPRFVHLIISSKEYRSKISAISGGTSGSMKNIAKSQFLKLRIPLPPVGAQQTLVAEVEAEQAIVDGNRDLVARFEKKIEACIARVWGDAKANSRAAA